jgi:ubiquinone/menaquinone biosynthesis C-methylase UbiE
VRNIDTSSLTLFVTPTSAFYYQLVAIDAGAGSGWVSEFCARMGLQTVAFNMRGDLQPRPEDGVKADKRIDPSLLTYVQGDGHTMPFEPGSFGHLLCYDTLHHMRDYSRVLLEFFRIPRIGGCTVAEHVSKLPST